MANLVNPQSADIMLIGFQQQAEAAKAESAAKDITIATLTAQSGAIAIPAVTGSADLADYRTGRVWNTDFSDPSADAANFDILNFLHVVDPATGLPALQAADTLYNPNGAGFTLSSVTTKAKMTAAEVLIRHRYVNGNTLAGQQGGRGSLMAGMRRNSLWVAGTLYGEGADYTGIVRDWTGGYSGNRFDEHAPYLLQTDTASFRLTRVQIFQDAMRYKVWREQDAEPAQWRYLTKVGAGQDFIADGVAGLFAYVLDASFISRLTVKELIRTTQNLLHNTSYGLIDSATGRPLWWSKTLGAGSAAVLSVETIPDHTGEMRDCLKVTSPNGSQAGSGLWQQSIYNSGVQGPNALTTFKREWPQSPTFIPMVQVSVWSKGDNVTEPNGGNGLCAGFVDYYYDVDGNLRSYESSTQHRYYEALGPRTLAFAGGIGQGIAGNGTWDWTETRYIMEHVSAERLYTEQISLGIHDNTATGMVWIGQVTMTPVGTQ